MGQTKVLGPTGLVWRRNFSFSIGIISLSKCKEKIEFVKVNIEDKLYDAQIYMPQKTLIAEEPWNFDYWYKNNINDFFSKEFNLNGVKEIKS